MMRAYNSRIIPVIRELTDKMYLDDVETVSPTAYFTDEQIRQLIREYRKTGNRKLMEIIVHSFSRYVVSIAKNYQEQGLTLSDLISEGMLGLMISIDKFDLKHKTKFVTYSNIVISRYMREALDYSNNIVRLPKNIRNNRSKTRELISVMQMKGASYADILEKIDDPNMIFFTNPEIYHKKSLSDVIGTDIPIILEDTMETTDPQPDRGLNLIDLKKDLSKTLTTKLTDEELLVIRFHFGLGLPFSITSIQDLARCLGMTREVVKTLLSSAIQKLREEDSLKILSKYI
jgi:RNA polymerase primary sigma factor